MFDRIATSRAALRDQVRAAYRLTRQPAPLRPVAVERAEVAELERAEAERCAAEAVARLRRELASYGIRA